MAFAMAGSILLGACAGSTPTGDERAGEPAQVLSVTTVTTEVDPALVRTATGAEDGPPDPRIGRPIDKRASARDLDVGMCVNETLAPGPDSQAQPTAWVVDCSTPHDAEVFALFNHPAPLDAPYLGRAELDRDVASTCASLFEGFIGLEYARSALAISYLRPDATTWAVGDREVVCSVHDAALKPLTVSVAGIAR